MTAIAVHPVPTGTVRIKRRQLEPRRERRVARVLDMLADAEWAEVPIHAYVIEHPEGVFVVDTGESARATDPAHTPRWHVIHRTSRFAVTPEQEVDIGLRALGHEPGAVRAVLMTHLHGDHVGGLGHFEGVEVLVDEREAKVALGPFGPALGYFKHHRPDRFAPTRIAFDAHPWETFDFSVPVTGDGAIRLLPTPGHTPGHLSVAVDRGDDVVLLTGDATYAEDLLLTGSIDGVAADARAHRDSTERIRALCRQRTTIVVPTHDPGAAGRLARQGSTSIAPR